jgi:HEAT repeat protein
MLASKYMYRWVCLFVAATCVFAQDPAATDDSKTKTKAIKDLAKTGPESIARIEPYLSDPSLDVRTEAVKAIVEIGGPRSLEPLVQATRDNDAEVQIRAVDGLVNFYSPGYLKSGLTGTLKRAGTSITSKFSDTNDLVIEPYVEVRPEVITALGKVTSGGASMTSRANAARALGILRGKGAIDDLVAALKSKDDQVMYESLVALQKIRDPEVAPRIAFLLNDPAEKIQVAALETTGMLMNKSAAPTIRQVIDRTRSQKVRRAAVSALAMLPDPANKPVFSSYLNDKDDQLRAAAAEGYARLNDPSDLPAIEKLFESEKKMNARLSLAFAAVSLGNNGLTEFSPLQYLVNALNSRTYRGVAEPFLLELTRNLGVRRTLYQVLKTGTRDERIYLARALARTGDQETAPYLEALASDSDTEVSQEGARALRTLKARL